MAGNLICSESIEQFGFLSESEAIRIDISSIYSLECSVEILLVVLLALDESHVWKCGEFLGTFG